MLAVIQFDSVSVSLLEELLAAGRLPTMAQLRERGTWLDLEADDADLAAAVYHTLHSGVTAGDHGLYHTFQWTPAEQRLRYLDQQPRPETVWERLSRSGRRSLIVDPFVNHPPRVMRGTFLSGWQFSNRIILQRHGVPALTRARLVLRHGPARRMEETLGSRVPAQLLRLARRLVAAPARAAAVVTDMLARESFDLLWVNIAPVHFAGHWLCEPARVLPADADPAALDELSGALQRVYEAADRAIGTIVAALPADADLIVLSPTGITTNTTLSEFLPGMVRAVLEGSRPDTQTESSPIWRLRAALPTRVRSLFSQLVPAFVNRALVARMYVQGLEWTSTRAFALPGETHGLIRLNVRGRERAGIVDPEDVPALLDELELGLRSFLTDDGSPAVIGVDRPAERWPGGARLDALPDLSVTWAERPRHGTERLVSAQFGEVPSPGVGTGWPGNHVDEAWALVCPGASRLRTPSRPPKLVDIAATACALTGVDGNGLAGEPLLERR